MKTPKTGDTVAFVLPLTHAREGQSVPATVTEVHGGAQISVRLSLAEGDIEPAANLLRYVPYAPAGYGSAAVHRSWHWPEPKPAPAAKPASV